MVYTQAVREDDLTAAWYAAAPPPPPSQTCSAGRDSTSSLGKFAAAAVNKFRPAMAQRTLNSATSQSMTFDKGSLGDDLPSDSHAPEPERPVSRNAMARARERERQRSTKHSNASCVNTRSMLEYNQKQMHEQNERQEQERQAEYNASVSPAPDVMRLRHDSSPANVGTWMPQSPAPPSAISVSPEPISPGDAASNHPFYGPAAQFSSQPWPTPASITSPPQPYSVPPVQAYAHSYSPHQGPWQHAQPLPTTTYASPSPVPYTYANTQVPPYQSPWPQQYPQYVDPGTNVPFPTNPMPPPPVPIHQNPVSAAATARVPLPSPSRSTSQSSSVGTGASVASLSSASGTIRRALPSVPGAKGSSQSSPSSPVSVRTNRPQPGAHPLSTVDPATLKRHESVRMAAEEIMSRGPPRRKAMSGSTRSTTHSNTSRSDGSLNDNVVLPGSQSSHRAHSFTPKNQQTVRGRAESGTCLEDEMRRMRLQDAQKHVADDSHHCELPVAGPIRAASPRPIRASPTPMPHVAISSPVEELLPARPVSRGPKDERERRKSMDMGTMQAPQVYDAPPRSPPPDTKPAVPVIAIDTQPPAPAICVDETHSQPTSPGIPSIVLPEQEQEIPCVRVVDEEDNGPSEQQPHLSASSSTPRMQSSISVSVSSTSIAQRSTSSNPPTQPPAPKGDPIRASAPASASSVGSGASCATCNKWIGGRVVHAMGQTFHPDCFVCYHCGENLEHVAFYEHEGRAYCHFDYHELFSKRCFHCRTPIVDQRYISINEPELVGEGAKERCYHDMHFFCANCGDPFLDPKLASNAAGHDPLAETIEDEDGKVRFGGREFVVHRGYPYCEKCHVSLHKPRCKGCRQPILDEDYLTALRAKWHVGCFCCESCKKPIDDDNFFVRNNLAYDEHCYKVMLRSEL